MDLILTVIAAPEGVDMLNHTKVFTRAGGYIGRAESNDWVLPDTERIVSSQHAAVAYTGQGFAIKDISTNGTFLNDENSAVNKGDNTPLNNGDTLIVGDYHLQVTIKQPQQEAGLAPGLESASFLDSSDKTTFSASALEKIQTQNDASQLDSWLDNPSSAPQQPESWGSISEPPASAPPSNQSLNSGLIDESPTDPMALLNSSPSAPAGNSLLDDDDWWKEGSTADHAPADQHVMDTPSSAESFNSAGFNAPEPAPAAPQQPVSSHPVTAANPFEASHNLVHSEQPATPAPAQSAPTPQPIAPAPLSTSNLNTPSTQTQTHPSPQNPQTHTSAAPSQPSSLAAALGLDPSVLSSPESLERESAAMIEETIKRLIDLLRARSSVKNELRVDRTMIEAVDNNPLKFSATPQDALKVMFGQDNASSFMPPRDAVKDSFDDLSDHQVAVLFGMRCAYQAMLDRFSPENLEKRLKTDGGSFLSNKSARTWEAYKEYYSHMRHDEESTYRLLYGDDFAEHYERQLAELKNARKMGSTQFPNK